MAEPRMAYAWRRATLVCHASRGLHHSSSSWMRLSCSFLKSLSTSDTRPVVPCWNRVYRDECETEGGPCKLVDGILCVDSRQPGSHPPSVLDETPLHISRWINLLMSMNNGASHRTRRKDGGHSEATRSIPWPWGGGSPFLFLISSLSFSSLSLS
jgi:hypothetical protein